MLHSSHTVIPQLSISLCASPGHLLSCPEAPHLAELCCGSYLACIPPASRSPPRSRGERAEPGADRQTDKAQRAACQSLAEPMGSFPQPRGRDLSSAPHSPHPGQWQQCGIFHPSRLPPAPPAHPSGCLCLRMIFAAEHRAGILAGRDEVWVIFRFFLTPRLEAKPSFNNNKKQ